MQRLNYPQKFLLIGVVIAIPFAVIFTLLQIQDHENLRTMHQEQAGNAYLVPVRQLLSQVSRAQIFAHAYTRGDTSAQSSLTATLAQADGSMNALAAADGRYGKMLDTTQSFTDLRTKWQDVRDHTLNRSTSDNDMAYGSLVSDLHELIEKVSNNSLLIIDTRLDSTHLTTALLDRLPTGLDLFRQTKLIGQDLPFGQALPQMTRLVYQNLTDQITANIQATQDSFDNAFNANPKDNLRPELADTVNNYASSGKAVLNLVTNQVTAGPRITATLPDYNAAISQAWDLNDQLWARSSDELARILQGRIDDVSGRNRITQFLPVLAALIALYLLMGLYSGLMRVIAALGDASRRMTTGGEIDHTVTWSTRDEMGRVVTSFNAIAARLRTEWAQAHAESDRATAAEAKLRSIVDTALDGIVTIDSTGRVSGWNPQAEAIFGWSEQEIVGTSAADLVAPSARTAFVQRVRVVLQTGIHQDADNRVEVEAVRRDGSVFPAEVAIASLQRRDSSFSLFIRDITERKRLREQEIEYLRNVALVTEAAAAVETGAFDAQSLAPVAAREDRLGQLARVFQRMAREVASREQQLKQQVQELRIEIDHQKTARQAAEITETEYFRELQRQAASLRQRPQQAASSPGGRGEPPAGE
jgi:PAS domain S-box-containing protein